MRIGNVLFAIFSHTHQLILYIVAAPKYTFFAAWYQLYNLLVIAGSRLSFQPIHNACLQLSINPLRNRPRIVSSSIVFNKKKQLQQRGPWTVFDAKYLITRLTVRTLAPSDFHIFPHMKRWIGGQHFSADNELQTSVGN